jgi:glycerol dehydrogenase-like iron-containing ADH family enzyme
MSDTLTVEALPILAIAPAQLLRGNGILSQLPQYLSRYGNKALVISGKTAKQVTASYLSNTDLEIINAPAIADCSDENLAMLRQLVQQEKPNVIVGIGGGKVLDTAKLIAHQSKLAIATVPTTGATCAAWTALSNVYDVDGSFSYDVTLDRCPEMMFVDYDVIATAPKRTLVSGIGDAIAKWYESSVSSGRSDKTMVIAAVQEARILRDILFQKSADAIANPNSPVWREVVDATVCLAGAIGGIGGASCRTVAAHAIHNALTHSAWRESCVWNSRTVAFRGISRQSISCFITTSIAQVLSRDWFADFSCCAWFKSSYALRIRADCGNSLSAKF